MTYETHEKTLMIKKIIIGIVLNGAALYGVTFFIPEIRYTGGIVFFALGGLVMGVLNTIVKPILKLLTLPLQIITMGLSLIVLNGVIFWILKVTLDTLSINGVTLAVTEVKTYFLAGFIFGVINWGEHLIIHNK